MHIRTRNDLINWLDQHAPYPAVKRSLIEGTIENFGAFKNYWIVKITSIFKKMWIIKIAPVGNEYRTVELDTIPWINWIGDQSQNKLYQGDNPELYKELRENARQTKE